MGSGRFLLYLSQSAGANQTNAMSSEVDDIDSPNYRVNASL